MNNTVAAIYLIDQVQEFFNNHVQPIEAALALGDANAKQKVKQLTQRAREYGLWGQFFPRAWGGSVDSFADYLPVAIEEGHTEFAPTLYGGHATLDAHMLARHGSTFLQDNYLAPLAKGEYTSAYAMTEPTQPGSIPDTLECEAKRVDSGWTLSGRKWFVCNALEADFVTVLAVTDKQDALAQRFTMFIVPRQSKGCQLTNEIPVLGRELGQGEFHFEGVELSDQQRLGGVGEGLALMQTRVGLGRLLRSAHWLGLAERCYTLAGERIHSERGVRTRLASKQLIRQHMMESYLAIRSATLHLEGAARAYDQGKLTATQTNLAKIVASRALCQAADSAVQIYGAEGLSDLTPLSGIYRVARTTRFLDGSDEALVNNIGKSLIQKHNITASYCFSEDSSGGYAR